MIKICKLMTMVAIFIGPDFAVADEEAAETDQEKERIQ